MQIAQSAEGVQMKAESQFAGLQRDSFAREADERERESKSARCLRAPRSAKLDQHRPWLVCLFWLSPQRGIP